jgi:hypothetical protein
MIYLVPAEEKQMLDRICPDSVQVKVDDGRVPLKAYFGKFTDTLVFDDGSVEDLDDFLVLPGVVIVTRHETLVRWLGREGITGEVIQQATPDDVAGKDVYGVLPLWLAVHANSVTEVSMPDITLEQRKRVADLTIEEMDEAGAHMVTYVAEVK